MSTSLAPEYQPVVESARAFDGGQHRWLHPGRESLPVLSPEEELRYARDYRDNSDLRSVGWCCRTCAWWWWRWRGYLGYGLPHADLIQEGNIGLMKAVKRFDPERGVPASFALHWIKAEIHEYVLRNWRLVKIATTKAQRKLFFNLRSHKRGRRSPAAKSTNWRANSTSSRKKCAMETAPAGGDTRSRRPLNVKRKASAPIAYLTDADAEPSRILEADELEIKRGEGLTRALDALDARSRRIIETRWLREGENN